MLIKKYEMHDISHSCYNLFFYTKHYISKIPIKFMYILVEFDNQINQHIACQDTLSKFS